MKKLITAFARVDRALERLLYFVALTAFVLFVVLILYQVISRNVRVVPVIQWTEELSRFAFMWMVMLGATIGVLRSDHFLIDIFEQKPGLRRMTRWLRELVVFVVLLVFIFGGYQFGLSGARRLSIVAQIPMTYIYMSFFFMGVVAAFFTLHRILILLTGGVQELDVFDASAPIVRAADLDDEHAGTERLLTVTLSGPPLDPASDTPKDRGQ